MRLISEYEKQKNYIERYKREKPYIKNELIKDTIFTILLLIAISPIVIEIVMSESKALGITWIIGLGFSLILVVRKVSSYLSREIKYREYKENIGLINY